MNVVASFHIVHTKKEDAWESEQNFLKETIRKKKKTII